MWPHPNQKYVFATKRDIQAATCIGVVMLDKGCFLKTDFSVKVWPDGQYTVVKEKSEYNVGQMIVDMAKVIDELNAAYELATGKEYKYRDLSFRQDARDRWADIAKDY